jgi:hypothetical protein
MSKPAYTDEKQVSPHAGYAEGLDSDSDGPTSFTALIAEGKHCFSFNSDAYYAFQTRVLY